MEDAPLPLAAGDKLDRYELLCPIASGGMASVWLARLRGKRGFEKLFAIKTIRTELIADPRFQQMFLDEARLASAIQHPNVAQIIDLGEQDETLYTVMEWVDGESLATIHRLALKRGTPLPLGVSLRVMADVCAGLHAAHELRDANDVFLGVVHRDVSPENILVTNAGGVKVIDFGIAKARRREHRDSGSGALKGKVRYMAPEQVNGLAVDRRADLWSVGVCLYELVTGKEPFGDDDDIDVLRRLMSSDPTPLMQGLSERLVPVLPVFTRSLVQNPEARFDDAAAMRRALLAAMDELGLSSSTSEDTADFLRTNLADCAKRRRSQVARAVEIADARDENKPVSSSAPAPALSGADDVALAPTLVSDPKLLAALDAADSGAGTSREDAAREARAHNRAASVAPPRGSATPGDQLRQQARGPLAWGIAGAAILALVVSLVWRTSSPVTPSAPSASPAQHAASAPPLEPSPSDFEILDPPPPARSGATQGVVRAAASTAPTAEEEAGAAAGIDAGALDASPAAEPPDAEPQERDAE